MVGQRKVKLSDDFESAFKIAFGIGVNGDPDRVPSLIGSHFRVDILLTYKKEFLYGLWVTLQLCLLVWPIGIACGVALAAAGAKTSVGVTIGTVTRRAIIIYASSNLVAGYLPLASPLGAGSYSVTHNQRTSAARTLRVLEHGFGIFTQSGDGLGPALIQNFSPEAGYRLNTFMESARPGQIMVLWGTGLGRTAGGDPNAALEVLVAGRPVKLLYAGPSGCCAGTDEIVFEAPAGVEGCFAPIAVRFRDGQLGRNFATMSIAARGGTCSDPHGLSAPDMERLQRRGSIMPRAFTQGSGAVTSRFWRGTFDTSQFVLSPQLPPVGSCFVMRGWNIANSWPSGNRRMPETTVELDAGPGLRLTGPRGVSDIPSNQPFPWKWEGGDYMIEDRAGGVNIGPFQTAIAVPKDPFQWTNRNEIGSGTGGLSGREIGSESDLKITWSGGDPAGEYVIVTGDTEDGIVSVPSRFICA